MHSGIKNKSIENSLRNDYLWSDKKRPVFGKPLSFTRYILYEDRLIVRSGILFQRQEEIRLYRVVDLVVRQSIFQRMFGVGSIVVLASDASTRKYILDCVRQPYDVAHLLSDRAESERARVGVGFFESIHPQSG